MKNSFINRCILALKKQGILGFLKKIKPRHFDPLKIVFYPYATLKISSEIKKSFSADSVVNFVFKKFGSFLKPYQVKSEILALTKIVENKKPTVVFPEQNDQRWDIRYS